MQKPNNVVSILPDFLSSLSYETIEERLIAIKKARSVKELQRVCLRNKKYLDSLISRSKAMTDEQRLYYYVRWYDDLAIIKDECKMMLMSIEDFPPTDKKDETIRKISVVQNALPALSESLLRKVSLITESLLPSGVKDLFDYVINQVKDFLGSPDSSVQQVLYSYHKEINKYCCSLSCDVVTINGYRSSNYYLNISYQEDNVEFLFKYKSDNPYLRSNLEDIRYRMALDEVFLVHDFKHFLILMFLNSGFVSAKLHTRIDSSVTKVTSFLRIRFIDNRLVITAPNYLNQKDISSSIQVFCYFLFGRYDVKQYLKASSISNSSYLFDFGNIQESLTKLSRKTLSSRLPAIKDLFSLTNVVYNRLQRLSQDD